MLDPTATGEGPEVLARRAAGADARRRHALRPGRRRVRRGRRRRPGHRALQQQRLLATSPREVSADDLAGIIRESLQLW
ncbi:MAG: hypothetical protein R2734_02835 [Nocardioides sp.]